MYVNLSLMCLFIGIKVVTVFLTIHKVLNPAALFDAGGISKKEAKIVEATEHAEAFAEGTRIVHPTRGPGVVYRIDWSDAHGKPFIVHYANMERHHYSKAQVVDKLQVDESSRIEWPDDPSAVFSPGLRIWHFVRGEAFAISFDKSRKAPYLLSYKNGQTSWYPAASLTFFTFCAEPCAMLRSIRSCMSVSRQSCRESFLEYGLVSTDCRRRRTRQTCDGVYRQVHGSSAP
jgi:hypothetical protein